MPARKPKAQGPVSRAELGRLLGVSLTTVDRWRRNGCPVELVDEVPHYPVARVVEWRIDRARAEAEAAGPAIPEAVLRRRRMQAETRLAELALEEAQAAVVPVDLVVELVGAVISNVVARLNAIPGRYAGKLARTRATGGAKKLLQEAVREVRGELSSGDAIAARARADGKGAKAVRGAARTAS